MRTLDEVIKALEYCLKSDEMGNCNGDCPYIHCCDPESNIVKKDALHYLKTIETTENLYHDAVNELSKWKDDDWKDRCLPLTWDELKQMEGKPVWLEDSNQQGEWVLMSGMEDDVLYFVYHTCNEYKIDRKEQGTLWKAYRKERS